MIPAVDAGCLHPHGRSQLPRLCPDRFALQNKRSGANYGDQLLAATVGRPNKKTLGWWSVLMSDGDKREVLMTEANHAKETWRIHVDNSLKTTHLNGSELTFEELMDQAINHVCEGRPVNSPRSKCRTLP